MPSYHGMVHNNSLPHLVSLIQYVLANYRGKIKLVCIPNLNLVLRLRFILNVYCRQAYHPKVKFRPLNYQIVIGRLKISEHYAILREVCIFEASLEQMLSTQLDPKQICDIKLNLISLFVSHILLLFLPIMKTISNKPRNNL